jgi:hypothetical protein
MSEERILSGGEQRHLSEFPRALFSAYYFFRNSFLKATISSRGGKTKKCHTIPAIIGMLNVQ